MWCKLRHYSFDHHLREEGVSFDAFDTLDRILDSKAIRILRKKMANRLIKEIRSDCQDQDDPIDLRQTKEGVYCIALDGQFEYEYEKKPSRILYIGSGRIQSRVQSHLEGKLFDFARELRVIPFRFYFADLTGAKKRNGCRALEQSLLAKFREEVDTELPLLNSINASTTLDFGQKEAGWDLPLQRDRGRNATSWLIKTKDSDDWKGALK